jgi:small subunit ribosomal protein S4
MAVRAQGVTGENLLSILERRLDNVVHRLGLTESRKQARQLITHGHFLVNGRKVTIPAFLVSVDDSIEIAPKSVSIVQIQSALAKVASAVIPGWLERDLETLKGRVVRLPERGDIDADIRESLIVEYYSR